MHKASNWLWGLVLILIGVVWGLSAMGLISFNVFFPGWWTLFIIVPCFIGLFDGDDDKTGDLIGLGIGIFLLLGCLSVVSIVTVWKLMVPVILVVVGLSIIFKDAFKKAIFKGAKKLNGQKGKEYWSTFSGQKLDFGGEEFEGCQLEAVFGGITCDLREAKIKEGAMIRATSIFGGITIRVPKDIEVKLVSTSMFGGASNQRKKVIEKEDAKTLYVDATCVSGGVEVK